MSEYVLAPLYSWLAWPMSDEVSKAIRRLRRAPDVQHVAVMPDVHLAEDVCVGVAIGTTRLVYPQAVGGDIGCGMLAVPFDIEMGRVKEPRTAASILAGFGRSIAARRRNRRERIPMPDALSRPALSDERLEELWRGAGTSEFATVGSGITLLNCRPMSRRGFGLWSTVVRARSDLPFAIITSYALSPSGEGSRRSIQNWAQGLRI